MKKKIVNMRKRPIIDDDEDDFVIPDNYKTPKKKFNPSNLENAPKKIVSIKYFKFLNSDNIIY